MQGVQFFSGAFILYSDRNEQLGAMRRKMAIFKLGNSVCRVQCFFQELSFYIQKEKIRGTMRQKKTILKEGNSGTQKFKFHFLFQVDKFKYLKIQIAFLKTFKFLTF